MKASHWKLAAIGLANLLFIVVVWSWCVPLQVRQITNEQLSEALGAIEAGNPNTAYWYTYVGASKQTVYLEYETMIHPLGLVTNRSKKTVLLIDKADIDESNTNRVRALGGSV